NVAGDLEVGDLAAAVVGDGVAVELRPAAADDPGHQLLAEAVVRHAHHLHVGDVRVPHQELLDLPRVDVLAAPDDHVLRAPDDVQVAVRVHHREVAGVHEAAAVDRL